MARILIGPAGIGKISEVEETFKNYSLKKIKCAEIPFTYGVYIKDKETANKVRDAAKNSKIVLSIHAPYWINLNSDDKTKIEASKKRILNSCQVAHWLSYNEKVNVVFHCGFYGKLPREKAFESIKNSVLEMKEVIKKNKWNAKLCPEVIGKKNVFGSIEEISSLVRKTGCGFCIDFAHVLARYGNYEFELIKKSFPQKKWHCHFSGIEYTEKAGERKHIMTPKGEWKKVLGFLNELDKEVTIINESPNPFEDSVNGIKELDAFH